MSDTQAPAPKAKESPPLTLGGCLGKLALLILSLLLIIVLLNVRFNFTVVEGEKVGQIFSVNTQGSMSFTVEAELIRGGLTGGSGAFGTQPFDFTVPTDELASQVRKYMRDQTEVNITYRQSRFYMRWNSDNWGIYLTGIHPAR